MRCFIGIDLAPSEKLALEHWREKALPDVLPKQHTPPHVKHKRAHASVLSSPPYAIPAANYHITLCFLGDITHRQHDAIISELDTIVAPPFSVTLDTTGVWNGPKILVAAPSIKEPALVELARSTRKAARASNISVEKREYRPHVTVIRKANHTLPPPRISPHIHLAVSAFHLFESVSTPNGVNYPIRHSWSLQHAMSVREQLRKGLI
ncbi:RNA 2',3'-cyclic phosphodiesterase [Alteromonas sp. A079]|uniref:RNA 2',3'-cyclic phosphodiesterase n=1 Tax=Alteromonas sp. A079 TaxID=3410268 RepID=UPI003B9F0FF9